MRAAYALHVAGNVSGAVERYRDILRADPDNAEALYLLGEIALGQGRPHEAIDLLRRAVRSDASVAQFHRELGDACHAAADFAASEAAYRAALALEESDVLTWVNLGVALERQGKLDAAARAWEGALERDPRCAEALANLGSLALLEGRFEEAEARLRDATRAAPQLAEPRVGLGEVLVQTCRPEAAAAAYEEATRLDPRSVRARIGLGHALETAGRIDEALASYAEAKRIDPSSVDAHVSHASLLLSRQDFARGWDEFEWRKRLPQHAWAHDRFALPEWDGSPGRRVLCYAEQGLGDQIMYASCVPDVLARASECTVDCDPRLVALFSRSFPRATLHGGSQSEPGTWARNLDCKVSLASLPRLFRRSPDAFPSGAYLKADPDKVERWRERLSSLGPGPKIGLSWRGGVRRTGRAWRSLDLDALVPVLRSPGQFVTLQYGEHAAELQGVRTHHGVAIHHFPEAIQDYDETAALVAALDLTISVCTAIIHVAGALGRPVWILAPIKPDARYGLEGPGMPWYRSARMFRQRRFGQWEEVVTGIADELAQFRPSTA